MTQISGTMPTGINVSRFTAVLWTALVFAAGVVLALVMFVAFNAPNAASTSAAAAGAGTSITRSDDYALRQVDASRPLPAGRDDYGLRQTGVRIGQAPARDDYSLRQGDAIGPADSQLDDFGIRHPSAH
jgi:hypothetical protein